MAVFSHRFLSTPGLTGTGESYVVPEGFVAVVKQITIYASALIGNIAVFFEDGQTGGALFASRFTINEGGWVGFYGAIVFDPGASFHFQVDNAASEGADVYAGGYLLSAAA